MIISPFLLILFQLEPFWGSAAVNAAVIPDVSSASAFLFLLDCLSHEIGQCRH